MHSMDVIHDAIVKHCANAVKHRPWGQELRKERANGRNRSKQWSWAVTRTTTWTNSWQAHSHTSNLREKDSAAFPCTSSNNPVFDHFRLTVLTMAHTHHRRTWWQRCSIVNQTFELRVVCDNSSGDRVQRFFGHNSTTLEHKGTHPQNHTAEAKIQMAAWT